MRTKHYLFLVLWITPKSRAKVCAQLRILKPPGSLLLTVPMGDFGVILTLCYLEYVFHVVFCILLLVIYM